MAIGHRDDRAMGWEIGKQPFDVASGMDEAAFTHAARRDPAVAQPIGRGHPSRPTSRRSSAIMPTASMASGATAPVKATTSSALGPGRRSQ